MNPITESDLHAYVDGQLDAVRAAEVEAQLPNDPDAALKIAAYRKQNELMHALFDPALAEPVPVQLMQRRTPSWSWMRIAASAATLALGIGIGFVARGPGQTVSAPLALSHQAAIAHVAYTPEVLHPVEVTAAQETHLVNWLSKRLNGNVRPPQLGAVGFELMGGRLLPGDKAPAAQFMYQDKRGQRLTLYVKRDGGGTDTTAFRYAEEGKLGVFYWVDRDFGYALSGELPKPELLRVAESVYRQLNP